MAQAKIERLKQWLGEDFPKPLPKPAPVKAPEITAPIEPPTSEELTPETITEVEPSSSWTRTVPLREPPQHKNTTSNPLLNKPPPPRSNHRPLRPFSERTVLFDTKDPNIGKLADIGTSFCPIVAVSKYPYKFVPHYLSAQIAEGFFDDGKFWYRPWDIYYIWPPALQSTKPVLLVPAEQVEGFLEEINHAIDTYLVLGSEAEEFGLVLKFPDHPSLRPRYLGHSVSRETFSSMERQVPDSEHFPNGEVKPSKGPDRKILEDWKYMMLMAFEVGRGKSKAAKAAKKDQRTAKQQQWKGDLKRAEKFLGFRPSAVAVLEPSADATWAEVQAYHAAKDEKPVLLPVDDVIPPPHEFHKSPVFISVDVECYEHDKSKVTEIGVAMLDTADLAGESPGKNGTNWHKHIKARHLRIKEHAHLRNGDFVSDAAEKFEFPLGGSEFVDMADAPRAIAACFRHPFCKIDRGEAVAAADRGEQADAASSSGTQSSSKTSSSSETEEKSGSDQFSSESAEQEPPKRTMVLVGHDIASDIRYLRRMGYDLGNLSNLYTTLDTASLHRALVHEWNPKSLAGLLYDFDLVGWNPHNAGNDAVYTLWVMVAIILQSATQRGDTEVQKKLEERKVERVKEAVVRAGTQAIEEGKGWSSGGEEGEPSATTASAKVE